MGRLCRILAAVAVFGPPVAAQGAGQDFTVVNRTGAQIDRIYVSSSQDRQWGANGTQMARLDDGQRARFNLPPCPRRCEWDLRVEYHDGMMASWAGLDLAATSRIALVRNATTKRTAAQPD